MKTLTPDMRGNCSQLGACGFCLCRTNRFSRLCTATTTAAERIRYAIINRHYDDVILTIVSLIR